ncbi:MAG: DUF2865 domain-containing protein [Rhizobiaceae bacterium]
MILPDAALAQPAEYCRQLEAQFNALGAGSRTNPQQIARYDNAIASQRGELRKAEDQLGRAGCTATRAPVCSGLEATVQRMRQNLSDLQHTRQRLASSAGLQAERTRLSAAMRAEGCAGVERAEATPAPDRDRTSPATPEGNMTRMASADSGSRYRTLCVRMCDGFFFPISHDTPRSLFERDEKLCAARCPGTEVQLHFHRFPGQESDEMISIPTGLPYREGENAFRYRQANWERPANCGCAPERGYDVLAGGDGWSTLGAPQSETVPAEDRVAAATTQRSGSFLIQEQQEQARASEPSTEIDEALTEAPMIDETTTAVEQRAPDAAAERPVRVVGPTFLPAPEEAIDLRSPDPYRAR